MTIYQLDLLKHRWALNHNLWLSTLKCRMKVVGSLQLGHIDYEEVVAEVPENKHMVVV